MCDFRGNELTDSVYRSPIAKLIPFRGPAITLLHSFLSPLILPGSASEIVAFNSIFFGLFPFVDNYSRVMVSAIGVLFAHPS
jgi:hypothetical protein